MTDCQVNNDNNVTRGKACHCACGSLSNTRTMPNGAVLMLNMDVTMDASIQKKQCTAHAHLQASLKQKSMLERDSES